MKSCDDPILSILIILLIIPDNVFQFILIYQTSSSTLHLRTFTKLKPLTLYLISFVHPIGQRKEDVERIPADGQGASHRCADQEKGHGDCNFPSKGPSHARKEKAG